MRHLLPLIPKPSHYCGNEPGAVLKDPSTLTGRVALAFPDLYEVGMSYAGQALLYDAVNRQPDLWAERVYAPSPEAAAVLRQQHEPLCTLESDTPLAEVDLLGFHLTHELCYTNVLEMLDLAGLPLRAVDRGLHEPLRSALVIAGGGCTFNAEPIAPFLDLMVLGDGEEILPLLVRETGRARAAGRTRHELLLALSRLPGVYVPGFYRDQGPGLPPAPFPGMPARVEKRIVPDLDVASYPLTPPQAFGAVHDRYTLEIARGCTRGCRFCQAGVIYRPVRERSLDALDQILHESLSCSGYEEISFLSLSAGDFSALEGLFARSLERCRAEQVAISLPSLRAGSLSNAIAGQLAGLRRTGATLAPEAGTQRLRDVINKGVTEEQILVHAAMLAANGWQALKLYFMIGLPTETMEDLDAILELCRRIESAVRQAGGRMQITAAISPFVPKPHTPFQWERQLGLEELRERLGHLFRIFRPFKRLRLRSHNPEMSFLEGIFARGDRRLAPVVEKAWAKGALFCSWTDSLRLEPWLEALAECGLEADTWLETRPVDAPLPWEHLCCGVSTAFLQAERRRALEGKLTPDCRFGACRNCGVCNHDGRTSLLGRQAATLSIHPRCNLDARDQRPTQADVTDRAVPHRPLEIGRAHLSVKAARVRLWYEKIGPGVFLSQLELQAVLERAMRRARLPLAFSQGFHPLPLLSFPRALPVGVASLVEYADLYLREPIAATQAFAALAPQLPAGLILQRVEALPLTGRLPQATGESYTLEYVGPPGARDVFLSAWRDFAAQDSVLWHRVTRKGVRSSDIRRLVAALELPDESAPSDPPRLTLRFDWTENYVSPLGLCLAVTPDCSAADLRLTKTGLYF